MDIKEEIFNFISTHESNDIRNRDEDIDIRFTTFGNRAGCKALFDVIEMLDDDMLYLNQIPFYARIVTISQLKSKVTGAQSVQVGNKIMDEKTKHQLKIERVRKMKNPTVLMNSKDLEPFTKQLETYEGIPIVIDEYIEEGNMIIYDDVKQSSTVEEVISVIKKHLL